MGLKYQWQLRKKSLAVIYSLFKDTSLMTNGLLQVVWIIDDATFVIKAKILPSLFVFRDAKGA